MDSNAIHHPSPAINMKCLFLDYIQLLMIGHAGWCTRTPFATSLQPKKWNAHFWITFNSWWSAGLVDGLEPHLPPLSSHKNEMPIFGLCSTSDDQPGWSMDSNPICHPSPAKKMKCSFLDYVQLLMIGQTGWWTRTPSTTHLQPRKWNAHFWVMFNFWWSARLVDGLKPHLPPISSQKHEMLVFGLHSTSDDQPGWSMDSNPICNPYPAKKNEMLIFGLHSTSDDKLDWSMDSNAIHHPSPAKNMKCLFLDYIQLLMIGQAGRCTRTPFATHLQPKKWNAHFWITFKGWWSARLVDGLEPHLPPPSSQKNEMPVFTLHSNSDDKPGWSMDSNSICHASPAKKIQCSFLEYVQLLMIGQAGWWTQTPSATPLQPKTWNTHFWIMFNFWWLAGLVDGLEPCVPPLCSQKNEMPIFRLHSTSDDWPGWSMDSNPICHPSPAKKMKCSFLDYVQLLMIRRAGWSTWTPSVTPLQPQKWNAHFWITFNFWWSAGLVNGLKRHPPPLSSHKHEMLVFGLHSTSDDWPGWSMHSNPIYHLSPATKMKCSFLDYIQLLMIGRAGRWTQTPSTTSLRRQKWNAHFWITFNFWWSAGLVIGLERHPPPLSSQKHEMLVFG